MLFAGFGVLLGSPGSLTVLVLMGFVCPVGLEFAMRQQGMWRGIVSARYLGALVLHVTVPLCWRKVWEVSGECITPGSPVGPTSCRTGISAAPDFLGGTGEGQDQTHQAQSWCLSWETLKTSPGKDSSPGACFFFPLWGLTQGLQLKLVFVCCSLSRAQQCSLQWLAAALFPAPQGSDIYCFTKSF